MSILECLALGDKSTAKKLIYDAKFPEEIRTVIEQWKEDKMETSRLFSFPNVPKVFPIDQTQQNEDITAADIIKDPKILIKGLG